MLTIIGLGPLFAMQTAAPTVRAAASTLAANLVPAGFVVSDQAFDRGRTSAVAPTTTEQRTAFRASLEQFLEPLSREPKDAMIVDAASDVLHLRSQNVPLAADNLLQRQISPREGAVTVADALMRLPELIHGEPRGIVGSGSAFQGCNWTQMVPSAPLRTSVEGYLDHLVTQVPGFIWFVTYRPTQSGHTLAIALGCSSGMFMKFTLAP